MKFCKLTLLREGTEAEKQQIPKFFEFYVSNDTWSSFYVPHFNFAVLSLSITENVWVFFTKMPKIWEGYKIE